MSHSNHHFLAILPLFAILSISPMQLSSTNHGRTIASVVVAGQPKYEARAAKIDRSKIVIDKDLDLDCLSDRQEAFRSRLLEVRGQYKVDITEKEAVELQRGKIETLVSSLVELEEEVKVLKDKKVLVGASDEKSNISMSDFKIILESLLKDEIENELIGLKAEPKEEKKEEAKVAEEKVEKPAKEEEKKSDAICDLKDKNLVLTKQVEELLAQQKSIMQTMMGLTSMMVQMNQQRQNPIQPWMMDGSMMNQNVSYPTTTPAQAPGGQWVYYPQSMVPTVMNTQVVAPNFQTTNPQLGSLAYQQASQSSQLSYLPIQNPEPIVPGYFGQKNSSFNFSPNNSVATNNFATSFGV
jgi:hypothetical protein